jgi:acetylornithine deacetylase/succinyl-diaminopimelate desuccinylase-like protein
MNAGLERRLGRLEQSAGIGDKAPRKKVILIAEPDESDGQAAIERYRAEYPESADDTDFIVVVTGFSVPKRDGMTWDGARWRETQGSVT